MHKYIDNKTGPPVEATIKTIATKDDLKDFTLDIRKAANNMTKGMFFFWTIQKAAAYLIFSLFSKNNNLDY